MSNETRYLAGSEALPLPVGEAFAYNTTFVSAIMKAARPSTKRIA